MQQDTGWDLAEKLGEDLGLHVNPAFYGVG
jgi:hypothetical protein